MFLQQELKRTGVVVHLDSAVDESTLSDFEPEHVVIATCAVTRLPEVEVEGADMVDAWSVISGQARLGKNIVVADWSCDCSGLGVAKLLARDGHSVRLLSGGIVASESIQAIVRDQWIGVLHGLGVEMIPYGRFYGATGGSPFPAYDRR